MMMRLYILSVLLSSFTISAIPIKLINSAGSYVWIDSDTLAPLVPSQLIQEAEHKGEFHIDAPHETISMLGKMFAIASTIVQASATNIDELYSSIFTGYFNNRTEKESIETLAALLSCGQRYFPQQALDPLAVRLAEKAGDDELDLTQTDIHPHLQALVGYEQRKRNAPAASIAGLLRTERPAIQIIADEPNTIRLRYSGRQLESVIGMHLIGNFFTTLDLSNNSLTMDTVDSFALSRFINLREIDLSGNAIADINQHLLEYPRDLEKLNLSHNKIKIIAEKFLSRATKLKRLDLSDNRITRLADGFLEHAPDTTQVYLAANPIGHDEIDTLPDRIRLMIKDIPASRDAKRKGDQIAMSDVVLPSAKKR